VLPRSTAPGSAPEPEALGPTMTTGVRGGLRGCVGGEIGRYQDWARAATRS
jgi:hypothetical protein